MTKGKKKREATPRAPKVSPAAVDAPPAPRIVTLKFGDTIGYDANGKPFGIPPKPPAQPEEGKSLGGRPTTYSDDIQRHTEEYFENFEAWYESPVIRTLKDGSTEERMERIANPPPSILDLHRYLTSKNLTCSRWSLYDWCEEGNARHIEAFAQTIKRGMERLYPEVLQENAMMGRYPGAFPIFAAKNRMKWTDKQEMAGKIDHNHTGEIKHTVDIGPLKDILNGPAA